MNKIGNCILIGILATTLVCVATSVRAELLPSWNDTPPKRAIVAFGNSDGDLEMLQWTTSGKGPRFALIVHHTDAQREWAYDRESYVGRLDRALDAVKSMSWTIVDMKKYWKQVFP